MILLKKTLSNISNAYIPTDSGSCDPHAYSILFKSMHALIRNPPKDAPASSCWDETLFRHPAMLHDTYA